MAQDEILGALESDARARYLAEPNLNGPVRTGLLHLSLRSSEKCDDPNDYQADGANRFDHQRS
jgi:hypothetical protein